MTAADGKRHRVFARAALEHREQGSIFTGATSPMGRQITISLPTALERAFPSRTEPVRRTSAAARWMG